MAGDKGPVDSSVSGSSVSGIGFRAPPAQRPLSFVPPLQTSLMWLTESMEGTTPDPEDERPILFFQYGITGVPGNVVPWARRAYRTSGWRIVLLNRRGHVHPLTVPSFNIVGFLGDVEFAVALIQKRYPKR